MFTISVCMIVKDEELTLSRILNQVKLFADEIIIVDTGSLDATPNIAKEFTDKVYSFEWCDDFSKARNYSISFATKDYFMWLDADDYITNENIDKINILKNSDKNIDMYMFKYVIGSPQPIFEFYRERLIKNNGQHKFEGAVHEAITPIGNIKYTDIKIEHRKVKVNNPTRNIDIYEKQIKQGLTLSPRDKYYYGRELFYLGKYYKSIKILKEYLKLNNLYTPDEIGASIIISDNYYYLKKYSKSNDALLNCISKHPPTAEICCKLAKNFENLNDINSAIFWYKSSLNCVKDISGFVNLEYYDTIPYIELTKLLYRIDKNEAKKYHLLAKACNPSHPSVIFNDQFFS
ncbi:MAG: glycosyltransferase [Christensenellales bacterium]